MHIVLHKIEVLIDRLIPPLLVALLVVIVGELFFSTQFEFYRQYSDWFDGLVVLLFATDLCFKYHRVRKLPAFIKKYWLEIIATLPFFLVFRLLEFLRLSQVVEKSQAVAHEAAAASKVEREVAVIVREAAKSGELSRTAKFMKTFKPLGRFPRMLKSLPFFERPTGQHHWHEKRNRR